MIGPGANLMPIPAAMAGALNTGYASGADLEFLFAERGSLIAAAGNALISCTRSGATATCFNRSGVNEVVPANTPRLNFDPATLRYENLVINSENLNGTGWTRTRCTVTDNATTRRDGLATAQKIVESTDNNSHYVRQSITITASDTHPLIWRIKAGERTKVIIETYSSPTTSIYARVTFDLISGTFSSANVGGGAAQSYSAEDAGDGWWDITQIVTLGGSDTALLHNLVLADGAGAKSYLGDGASGVYFERTQVNTGSTLLEYSKTIATAKAKEYACLGLLVESARTNLAKYSAQFDDGWWGKTRATITPDATTAPDGTTTADKLVVDATGATSHYTRTSAITVSADTTHTCSVFFKAAEHPSIELRYYDSATANDGCKAVFNSTSGTVALPGSFGTGTYTGATITECRDGWFRATLTGKTNASATSVRVQITVADSSNSTSITDATATEGVYIWGAQVEEGAFATSYIPTTSAAVTRNADVVTVNGVPVWFNETEGTILVEWDEPAFAVSHWLAAITLDSSNRYGLAVNSSNNFDGLVTASGTDTLTGSFPTLTAGLHKAAIAYRVNDAATSVDGQAAVQDSSVTLPAGLTTATIGSGATSANCHIRRFAYWRTREANAYIEALTA